MNRSLFRYGLCFWLAVPHLRVTNEGPVDASAPTFREFRADDGVWLAGQPRRLFVRITDDVSGVDPATLTCGFFLDAKEAQPNCGNPRAEGNDWYSLEITPGAYVPSGTFGIDSFSVSDYAGNSRKIADLGAEGNALPSDGYYHEWQPYQAEAPKAFPSTGIKLVRLKLRNEGTVDTQRPRILAIRAESSVWKAGETLRVHVQAVDEGSGIFLGSPLKPYSAAGLVMQAVNYHGNSPQVWTAAPRLVPEGHDWYYADFPLNAYTQGGEYVLSILDFSDNADNEAQLFCVDGESLCRNANGPALPGIRVQVVR